MAQSRYSRPLESVWKILVTKFLPAALKKYNITTPWEQYALYIAYGDQERCLGMEEKPLILFKQLDKEGKKPMFKLRKMHSTTADTQHPLQCPLVSQPS
jgi:hypothetical protein